MDLWKINLMNCILYELTISNITIIIWHGFYVFLDQYLYPDDMAKSIWICSQFFTKHVHFQIELLNEKESVMLEQN